MANKFGSIENIRKASTDELANVEGVGAVIAESINEWFSEKWHQKIIEKWEKSGVALVDAKPANNLKQTLLDYAELHL